MSIGIYIHIPFCKAKCLYCDFNSYSGMESWKPKYINELKKEIINIQEECEVDTLYIGGGTPTVLSAENLAEILSVIRENFVLTPHCEISVECNPATMGKEGFTILKQAGFNRLSIGLQSAKDAELRRLGRIHTFKDFSRCFSDARNAGFENISLDLMHGLPGQTLEGWQETMEAALAFQPEHISCYGLKLEEGTPLFLQNPVLPDDDAARELYEACVSYLAAHGYYRYEISNFALPGKESRHNCKYWRCEDFIGFGAGAYSCLHDVRYDNVRDIREYCARLEEGKSVIAERTPLSLEDKMSEFCFLGLRMTEGVSVKEFSQRFGKEIEEVYGDAIKKNLRRGTLLRLEDRLVIPPQWLYVSNSILVDFI